MLYNITSPLLTMTKQSYFISLFSALCIIFLCGPIIKTVHSFQIQPTGLTRHAISPNGHATTLMMASSNDNNKKNNDEDSDFGSTRAGGDSYEGDVDWDAEWKKVVQDQNSNVNRPGKDFYKNDVERAVGKTTRAAQENLSKIELPKVDIKAPSLPSFSGDAKFWLTVLAVLSFGSAILAAASNPYNYNNIDSFTI